MAKEKEKIGGFRWIGDALEDSSSRGWSLPITKKCYDPEHRPPGHVVLPPGIYEYTCPGCGETRRVVVRLADVSKSSGAPERGSDA